MNHLMNAGQSWSGRERTSAFLNFRDGSFATISAASGLDLPDDGRALAVIDWDRDGDLDLWFKNRTGPTLRFFRNDDRSGHRWIAFRLEGDGRSVNRDAVGARIELWVDGKKRVKELACGSGYLAQSSAWLHFGLGESETIDKAVVRWPGGERQEFTNLATGKFYRIAKSSDATVAALEASMPPATLADAAIASPKSESNARIVLRVPLALPPSILQGLFPGREPGQAGFVNLWAQWCKPCVGELEEFSRRFADLREAGLDFLALGLDKPEDRDKAKEFLAQRFTARPGEKAIRSEFAEPKTLEFFEAILRHVRFLEEDLPLPASFLFDKNGNMQIVYVGPVSAEQLIADAKSYGIRPEAVSQRSPFPGRWYFGMPRDLASLAKDLRARGFEEEARFYEMRDKFERQRFDKK